MQEVKFSCTALAGKNLRGALPVDADGYYAQPIGGLNCYNSANAFYPLDRARQLFEQSSGFMRRVQTGCMKGEYGHPKRLPGQSDESFLQRVITVEEKSVCVHFSEIWLDFNSVKDERGRPIVAVMAKFKPSGPYASSLESSLNNPKEDVCFSVRAFTDDTRRAGVLTRDIADIITYDFVTEPGINSARKYKSPTLESMSDMTVTQSLVEKALTPSEGFALESSFIQTETLFKALGWDLSHLTTPKYLNW